MEPLVFDQEEENVGEKIILCTNHYKLLPSSHSSTPQSISFTLNSSSSPSITTPCSDPLPIPSTLSTHPSTPTSISSSFTTTTTTTTTASTLVIYRLIVAEERKAQLDLPLPARTQVIESMKETHPDVFRGRVLIAGQENLAYSFDFIPETHNTKFQVFETGDHGWGRTFEVELQQEDEVPIEDVLAVVQDPATAPSHTPRHGLCIIKILEDMLLYEMSLHYERRGNNVFFPQDPPYPPTPVTPSREMQMGYFLCLTPASSLLLSMDVCQPIVTREVPLLSFLKMDLGRTDKDFITPLPLKKSYEYSLILRNLKVRVTHSRIARVYRVLELAAKGADTLLMHIYNPHTGQTTPWTIEQYFRYFYGITLKYPRFNCLHVAPKHRLIFLPIEVCLIAGGQDVTKRRGEWELHDVEWDLGPEEREAHLSTLVKSPFLFPDPFLTQLHLILDKQAIRVKGRVLTPPRLLASGVVVPEEGRWELGTGLTLHCPAYLHTWAVVQYDVDGLKRNTRHIPFLARLMEVGKSLGMRMNDPSVDVVRKVTKPMDDLIALELIYPYLQITVFLMRGNVSYLHEDTKHVGNCLMQSVTQCIRPDTYREKMDDDRVLRSILLQMNAKCGGINVLIDWPSMLPLSAIMCKPVLVVGATVNRPPCGGGARSPYLTVMVGMMCASGGHCVTMVHAQHCHHYITNTPSNITQILLRYYELNKKKPEILLMYRLDIPEHQIEKVTEWETEEMRKACRFMQSDGLYQPPITYICITRAHHTRLFRGQGGGGGNVPPGTVVESCITHPLHREFFLCSHPSDKGTSRPTHYRVVCDENNLTMAQLQTITYGLCHLHASCTHAITLPMPAAYARQAGQYTRKIVNRMEGHVVKEKNVYDPAPLVTDAAIMDHHNKLHTVLYYL